MFHNSLHHIEPTIRQRRYHGMGLNSCPVPKEAEKLSCWSIQHSLLPFCCWYPVEASRFVAEIAALSKHPVFVAGRRNRSSGTCVSVKENYELCAILWTCAHILPKLFVFLERSCSHSSDTCVSVEERYELRWRKVQPFCTPVIFWIGQKISNLLLGRHGSLVAACCHVKLVVLLIPTSFWSVGLILFAPVHSCAILCVAVRSWIVHCALGIPVSSGPRWTPSDIIHSVAGSLRTLSTWTWFQSCSGEMLKLWFGVHEKLVLLLLLCCHTIINLRYLCASFWLNI